MPMRYEYIWKKMLEFGSQHYTAVWKRAESGGTHVTIRRFLQTFPRTTGEKCFKETILSVQ